MKNKLHKAFKKKHRVAKKKAKFILRHPFLMPTMVFFALVFFGLVLFVALGGSTQGARDNKIVDLYVDEEQQTVTTRAKTVEELLERLDIQLIDEDIVEPARDAPILEDNTQVNVYRARPVDVIDGDRTITVLTAQRAPRLVASEAGVKLFPEDNASFGRNIDASVLVTSASEQVVIERATEIQINIYGVVSTVRTTAETVQQFLEENDIVVQDGATLQPENSATPITEGLLVAVNQVGIKTVTETEPVPFETETREDPNLQVGESRVEQAGVEGEATVIYQITEKDGKETSRKVLEKLVLKKPTTEIIVQGKKPATLSANINVSAEKASLMSAAGISADQQVYADFIISRESGWRPGAVNSSSGAYGLCQAYPASKMTSAGADWRTNPVTQLRWCNGYAVGRYGSWQGAYNAWLVQHWW